MLVNYFNKSMKLDLNSLVVVSQQDNHNIIWEKALSLPLLEDRKLLVSEDQNFEHSN